MIEQVQVRNNTRKGRPGTRYDHLESYVDEHLPNASTRVLPSWEIEATGATDTTDYTLYNEETGESVTYTSDGSATVQEIADGLAAAWNASPMLRGIGLAESDGVDTVTITSNLPDDEFTVEETSATGDLSLTETEGSNGTPVTFGRAVYRDSDGNATLTYPGVALATDLVGIALLQDDEPARDLSGSGPSGATFPYRVAVGRRGRFWVQDGDSASPGDQIYIGTSANAEQGRFFASSGAGRTALPLANGKWLKPNVIELFQG